MKVPRVLSHCTYCFVFGIQLLKIRCTFLPMPLIDRVFTQEVQLLKLLRSLLVTSELLGWNFKQFVIFTVILYGKKLFMFCVWYDNLMRNCKKFTTIYCKNGTTGCAWTITGSYICIEDEMLWSSKVELIQWKRELSDVWLE